MSLPFTYISSCTSIYLVRNKLEFQQVHRGVAWQWLSGLYFQLWCPELFLAGINHLLSIRKHGICIFLCYVVGTPLDCSEISYQMLQTKKCKVNQCKENAACKSVISRWLNSRIPSLRIWEVSTHEVYPYEDLYIHKCFTSPGLTQTKSRSYKISFFLSQSVKHQ